MNAWEGQVLAIAVSLFAVAAPSKTVRLVENGPSWTSWTSLAMRRPGSVHTDPASGGCSPLGGGCGLAA